MSVISSAFEGAARIVADFLDQHFFCTEQRGKCLNRRPVYRIELDMPKRIASTSSPAASSHRWYLPRAFRDKDVYIIYIIHDGF